MGAGEPLFTSEDLGQLPEKELIRQFCAFRDALQHDDDSELKPNREARQQMEAATTTVGDELFKRLITRVEKIISGQVFGKNAWPRHGDQTEFCHDAVSATMVNVTKGICSFEARASVNTWLAAIATNTVMDLIRKEIGRSDTARRHFEPLDRPTQTRPGESGDKDCQERILQPDPLFRSHHFVSSDELLRAVGHSHFVEKYFTEYGEESDSNRRSNEVIELRIFDGHSTEEVAERFGTTVGAVYQTYSRDLRNHRERLKTRFGITSLKDV